MSRWNRVETAYLCRLYQEYPNLYDKSNINYKNNKMRDRTLKEIANKFKKIKKDVPPNEIRLKLKTLRTQFTAELRNIQINEETAYKPKLWCYQQLKFLMEHLEVPTKQLEPKTTTKKASFSSDSDEMSDDEDSSSANSHSFVDATASTKQENTATHSTSIDSDPVKKSSSSSKKKKRSANNEDEAYSKFLISLLNKVQDKDNVKWKILDYVRNKIKSQNNKPQNESKNTENQNDEQDSPEVMQRNAITWITSEEKTDCDTEYIEVILENDDNIDSIE